MDLYLFYSIEYYNYIHQGISFWEALNHGLTAIATGGFSITDDSLRGYSTGLQLSFFFITIVGALNFNLYSELFRKGNFKGFFLNVQVIAFMVLLILGITFLHLDNRSFFSEEISLMKSVFQVGSALGTAGFQTADVEKWSPMALLLLAACMMIGGNCSSTTSGIKTFRLLGLLKGTLHFMRSIFYPVGKKLSFNIGNKEYSTEESVSIYSHISVFVTMYVLTFLILSISLYYTIPGQNSISTIFFESASTFNNVGLTTGITGPGLPATVKIIMIAGMIVGRIELIPFYILFYTLFSSSKENSLE